MLRCVLISSDPELTRELETALATVRELEVVKVLTECPSSSDLLRTIRVRKASLLLFSVNDLLRFAFVAKVVDDLKPGFPIITAGNHDDASVLRSVMHLGVREHISSPIDEGRLREAVAAAAQRLQTHPIPTQTGRFVHVLAG